MKKETVPSKASLHVISALTQCIRHAISYENEDEDEEPKNSLFPLQSSSSPNSQSQSQWLQNTSFTTNLSVVNDAVSSIYNLDATVDHILKPQEEDDDEEKQTRPMSKPYQLLDSDSEKESDSGDRKRRRKKKKRKRHEGDEKGKQFGSRKSGVWAWANSDTKPDKDYYFDSRGDRDNLAFGSLYRMDLARYKLYNPSNDNISSWKYGVSRSGDGDADALDSKAKSDGRYCSAKYAALERHRELKRIRVTVPRTPTPNPGEFISILEEVDGEKVVIVEESWEDEVLRKTREFNKMTRENPHDEKVWLAFAEFQDRVTSRQTHKGARLQTLEKKISILEKASELNPDNEDLLLCLLKAYQCRDTTDVLMGRWEEILKRHSGSCKLWKEFLRVVKGDFSMFKVSDVRKMYANAIQSLFAACAKQHRQVHQSSKSPYLDCTMTELELGLVEIFLSLCKLEWQAGYRELATALLQAEIEYSVFCPSLFLTEISKQRLFEHFWNADGARLGEAGAVGWSTWLAKEEENRKKIVHEEAMQENQEGGWTGWREPFVKSKLPGSNEEKMAGDDMATEVAEEEIDIKDAKQEDDTEALLKMLGIDVDADVDDEVNDTSTWTRWSKEEETRDCNQWMPLHAKSGAALSHSDEARDEEGQEQLSRVILYEDIREYLFSIRSDEARLSLVYGFVDFFGGKISHICTNASIWMEKITSLEALSDSILNDLRRVHDIITNSSSVSTDLSVEILTEGSLDMSTRTDMMIFLRNATLLCLNAFPRNYILEEAALVAEELSKMDTSRDSMTPCRSLARSLLKSDRQDVLLCGVYAQREAACGNIDHARKVFDMALSSIEGLPQDHQSNKALLYFWYADLEISHSSSSSIELASARAIHILSCFGSGATYSPFKNQASALQLLKAHQGFKEQIRQLRFSWLRGAIDDQSTALICAAALFEELTSGWAAASEVLYEALSLVLPEQRSQSYQLEFLFNYYLGMLWKYNKQMKSSTLLESVTRGLQIYPFSSKLFSKLVEICHVYAVANKLRWKFDDYCQKKPSVVVWLFALSFEIIRGGSQHRIHGLFERALANDRLRNSVILWRFYIAYEVNIVCNPSSAKRIYFRAIHACPWSKRLWLDGFRKLSPVLTAKELSDLQEVMRDKELNLRTDIYEILLQDDTKT
ncbi:siRNA-mediated silencing protein NRDE-2 [Dillenia turbinata]|uniref:SiRNA-mediated silencing protein NRDE-2 n=1 Tax=Dillenia turbinata TaxID=194707 RepID=A0AAN8V9V5_9MAGN